MLRGAFHDGGTGFFAAGGLDAMRAALARASEQQPEPQPTPDPTPQTQPVHPLVGRFFEPAGLVRGSSAEAEAAGAATRDSLARVSGSELLTLPEPEPEPEPEDRSPRPAGEATLGAPPEPGLGDPTAGQPLPAPSRNLPSEPAVHDTSMLPPLTLLALPDPVLIELLCRLEVRDLAALRAAAAELFRGQAQWQGRGLVEETARLLVARRADRELAPLLPQFGWLRSLEELRQLAQPLAFTAVHERLSTSNGGRSCTKAGAGAGYHTAFCHKAVMR